MNSNYDMLLSISSNWDAVIALLEQRNALEKLNDLQKSTVDEIIAFLKPMKEATIEIEASKQPTLYLVQLYLDLIKNHLTVKPSDSNRIMLMKELAQPYFDAIIATCITKYHEFSLYLHPIFKGLRSLSTSRKEEITLNVSIVLTIT